MMIKTQTEYLAQFARLSAMMSQDFAPGSAEEVEFLALVEDIAEYERETK